MKNAFNDSNLKDVLITRLLNGPDKWFYTFIVPAGQKDDRGYKIVKKIGYALSKKAK